MAYLGRAGFLGSTVVSSWSHAAVFPRPQPARGAQPRASFPEFRLQGSPVKNISVLRLRGWAFGLGG